MRRPAGLLTPLVLVAALGLLAPPPVRAADGRAPISAAANTAAAEPQVIDVALQGTGELTGQVVGQDGKSIAREPVYVLRQGTVVGTCQTDTFGRFAITRLNGGVYDVRWAQGGAICRLWAPETAPPSARPDLLLTANAVVRGQTGTPNPGRSWLKGPLPWIVAGAAIVAVTWADIVVSQKHRYERDHPSSS